MVERRDNSLSTSRHLVETSPRSKCDALVSHQSPICIYICISTTPDSRIVRKVHYLQHGKVLKGLDLKVVPLSRTNFDAAPNRG
jgi:hypothetical protein